MIRACHRATILISQSHERPLTLGERLLLWVHVSMCGMCRRFRLQIDFLEELAARSGEDEGARLSPQARSRILEALRGNES